MEKDIKLGGFAELDLSISQGVAQVAVKSDAGALVDKLKALVEAKLPAGLQPAEELAFNLVKSLVVGL